MVAVSLLVSVLTGEMLIIPVPAVSARLSAFTTPPAPAIFPALVIVASLVTVISWLIVIVPTVSSKAREAPLIPLVASTVPTVKPPTLVLLIFTAPTASTAKVLTFVWPRVITSPDINSNPAAAITSSPVTSSIAPAAVRVALFVTVMFLSMFMSPPVSVKAREAPLIPPVVYTVPIVSPPAMVLLIAIFPPAFTARVSTAASRMFILCLAFNSSADAEIEPPC